MKQIILAFIPIFVAVDAVGVLPIFVSLTRSLGMEEKRKIIMQSIITAITLAIGFVFLGKWIFKILGITIADFMIAGGVVLFGIAMIDLVRSGKERRIPGKELGAVPLGTPLITGPAVLATSLIMLEEYGLISTLISIVSNIILAGLIFLSSDFLMKRLGDAGSRALSKVMSLLLAAIGVMLIRRGVALTFNL